MCLNIPKNSFPKFALLSNVKLYIYIKETRVTMNKYRLMLRNQLVGCPNPFNSSMHPFLSRGFLVLFTELLLLSNFFLSHPLIVKFIAQQAIKHTNFGNF